jgi:hypothetical protein
VPLAKTAKIGVGPTAPHSLTTQHRKLATASALALALLIAQLGAVVHAYTHVRAIPRHGDSAGTPSQLCADCLAFAPLLAPAQAAAAAALVVLPAAHRIVQQPVTSLVDRAIAHFFESRAPPRSI